MLTPIHLDLLHLIEENSRRTPDILAAIVGREVNEVKAMIQDMENAKIILRYSATINWEKVETNRVTAFIDVKVTPQRGVGFDSIAERIYRFPEVRSVSLMSGAYDLSIAVEGSSIQEVARFVSDKLSTIEHIISTTTHFKLKTYKQEGVIFEDQEEDHRLVISP
ncbi:MAG: transcriptional regulator, AsnC family [Bacilli bacterium]|nr:transcriptional regulator, AsnC family [Bacilli bacterium]